MSPRKMLAAALHYALDLGRPVIPLAPRAKNPITRRGLRDASMREETIRAWWERTPEANVGLLTGGGLIVVDIDGETGRRSLAALERKHGRLPETIESRTSRGTHLLYRVDGDARTTAGTLGPGIDTRGERGYIVAPPSIHRSGAVYRWRRGHDPDHHGLADAPSWLIDLLAHTTCAVPGNAPRKQHKVCAPADHRDGSSSGEDWRRALEMMRGGASDDDVAKELRRRSAKYAGKGAHDEGYLQRTILNARTTHEANAPRAKVREVRLQHLPARFGRSALTRVHLDLLTGDGELFSASIVVPSPGYTQAAETWAACFPDVDPATLTASSWGDVRRAWEVESPKWIGRSFEVAARNGEVRWIRAVPETRQRGHALLSETTNVRQSRRGGGTR